MLLKYQALQLHLKKNLAPIYIVCGTDTYLLENAASQIKTAYKQQKTCEEKKLSLHSADDWQLCLEEANSYALFAENTLIDAYYEKKTFDAAAKNALTQYMQSVNPRCLLLIHAPEVPSKQLQTFANHANLVIVVASPFDAQGMRSWIVNQLQSLRIAYEPEVPHIIQQHTESNMLACAQVIEKIALTVETNTILTTEALLSQLSDQSQYQLFDLATACIQANTPRAMSILRHAEETRAEPTLVLWVLTNEIRLLLQLQHQIAQGLAFNNACNALKIWSTRISGYQQMVKRLTTEQLQLLLRQCCHLDERIKTSQGMQIWQGFESIALSLCIGSTL